MVTLDLPRCRNESREAHQAGEGARIDVEMEVSHSVRVCLPSSCSRRQRDVKALTGTVSSQARLSIRPRSQHWASIPHQECFGEALFSLTWRAMRFPPLGLRSGLGPNPVLLQSRETPCLLGRAPYV